MTRREEVGIVIERSKIVLLLLFCISLLAGAAAVAETLCEHCQKPIGRSRWVEVEGHRYHDDHFLCAHCNTPIKPVVYYEVDGRFYDTTCYADHIAPRCGHCEQPLLDEWTTQKDGSYHRSCFEDHIANKCFVGGEIISDGSFLDGFGNHVCDQHYDSVTTCSSCDRFLDSAELSASQCFPDGRLSCLACLSSAIMELAQARPLMDSVIGVLSRFEIRLKGKVPLKLVSQAEPGFHEDTRGITRYEKQTFLHGDTSRMDSQISILYGLSRIQFLDVIAHELMHVWLFRNGPDDHEDRLCEGSCEYASYLALLDDNSEESQYFIDRKLAKTHPVYGEGFRRVKQFVDEVGLVNWLEYLKENSTPPW